MSICEMLQPEMQLVPAVTSLSVDGLDFPVKKQLCCFLSKYTLQSAETFIVPFFIILPIYRQSSTKANL